LDGNHWKSKTFSTLTTTFVATTTTNTGRLCVTKLHMERMAMQPTFEEFKLVKLQVPPSRPESAKGFPFEFELRRRMVHDLRSYTQGFGDPTTHTSTPKSMEEVAVKVMKADKVADLFQTMVM
jgi:hypothetical protein